MDWSDDDLDVLLDFSLSKGNRLEKREVNKYGKWQTQIWICKKYSGGRASRSSDNFAHLNTDEKLVSIYDQLNRNFS